MLIYPSFITHTYTFTTYSAGCDLHFPPRNTAPAPATCLLFPFAGCLFLLILPPLIALIMSEKHKRDAADAGALRRH